MIKKQNKKTNLFILWAGLQKVQMPFSRKKMKCLVYKETQDYTDRYVHMWKQSQFSSGWQDTQRLLGNLETVAEQSAIDPLPKTWSR